MPQGIGRGSTMTLSTQEKPSTSETLERRTTLPFVLGRIFLSPNEPAMLVSNYGEPLDLYLFTISTNHFYHTFKKSKPAQRAWA